MGNTTDLSQEEWVARLRGMGYATITIQEDSPEQSYPAHVHPGRVAHVILRGDMVLTVNDEPQTLTAGDMVEIPPQTPHAAMIGPLGCTYLIGE